MSGYFVKNPGSTLDFTFDWGFQFLDDGEEISSDQGWSIHPDTAGAGGLAVDSASHSSSTTTANLTGGKPGEAYLACSSILTTSGREIQRSLVVRIANN